MLKKAYITLGVAILCFVLSWVLFKQVDEQKDSLSGARNYVQTRTTQIISEACHVHSELASQFKKEVFLTFSDLTENTRNPVFVYRNDSLIYWSDYKVSPLDAMDASKSDVNYYENDLGRFLVVADHYFISNQKIDFYSIIPLERSFQIVNKYLDNGINKQLFPQISSLSVSSAPIEKAEIVDENGDFLFSIVLSKYEDNAVKSSSWWVLSLFSGLFVLLLSIHLFLYRLRGAGRYDLVLGVEIVVLLILRSGLLIFEFPNLYTEFWLFSPEYYAASVLAPSLGDLVLNALVLGRIGWLLFVNMHRLKVFYWVASKGGYAKTLIALIAVLIGYSVTIFFELTLASLYQNSQQNYDVTYSFEWSRVEFVYILIFLILSFTYFSVVHVTTRFFLKIIKNRFPHALLIQCFALALVMVSYVLLNVGSYFIPLIHFSYVAIIGIFRLPGTLRKFTQPAYLYIVICAFFCASYASLLISTSSREKQNLAKKNFAEGMLTEYDLLGEYLLVDARSNIEEDNFIKNLLLNPLSSKDLVVQKIKRVYLSNYFDKYDVHVYIFDHLGNSLYTDNEDVTFASLVKTYKRAEFETKVNNLFYVNDYDKNVLNRFLTFINVEKNDRRIGYIVLDLKLKKIIPHSVYPRLLVDDKYIKDVHEQDYQYGIYLNNKLQYSFGTFNYQGLLGAELLTDEKIQTKGITLNGYDHLMLKSDDGKQVVVSSRAYDITNTFSNFSFLFLILVFIILLIIVANVIIYRFQGLNINFSTKIQIYLNIAYFLPLVVVSVTTLSTINQSYFEDLKTSFQNKAESISGNISDYVEGNIDGEYTDEYLTTAILRVARYTESDLNLFNERGELLLSSQPLIYESGLLSKYINPKAFGELAKSQNQMVMLQEKIGDLSFNSVYTSIKSNKTGETIGILTIPFFNSEFFLDKKRTEVLTRIMNIFTSFFLMFLAMSYIASRTLIVPLKLITQKLRKTTLVGKNEQLEWNSDDELGLLVDEYNLMLVKLEESTKELAKTEKESAWREMAQQVAHEIKNPLTPMKLTLQHLQRKIQDEENEQLKKSVNTLLDQVETLNDIATSFSSFAKMPIPRMERYDVKSVLLSTITLYDSNEGVEITSDIEEGDFEVNGDEKLMGRIFTNLILNGIQSVPEGRDPHIVITMSKRDGNVLLEFKDNGSGIEPEVQDKVFVPNFSTKYAGSGIGLAVAKRGIMHAGGKIWFETNVNIGTVFYIELPLIDQSHP